MMRRRRQIWKKMASNPIYRKLQDGNPITMKADSWNTQKEQKQKEKQKH